MTITIIGQGYVGLVSAAIFSDLGNSVYGLDIVKERIENLKKGTVPFYEPGLEEIIQKNLKKKRLIFTTDYKKAIEESQVIFICVGTPSKESGEADLSYVFSAIEKLAKYLNTFKLIVVKSTVPVGTNRKIRGIIEKTLKKDKKNFGFLTASCPEFLREGTAIHDTLNPDRIVIGADSPKAQKILLELHKPINGQSLLTDIETAEMIKYAANAFLATKISFANSLALICEKTGANVEDVMEGIGMDKRIGRSFLYPGIGYGGSCLPKDVKALVSISKNFGVDFSLLEAVDQVNIQMAKHFIDKLDNRFNKDLKGILIGVWGLSFKPNTDDMREAASLKILPVLIDKGAILQVYDPHAMAIARKIFGPKLQYCQDPYRAAKNAEVLLILTEWNEFKLIDLSRVKKIMKKPIIFDGRNIYDSKQMANLGFKYYSIGRKSI